jgi:hypothetical protein
MYDLQHEHGGHGGRGAAFGCTVGGCLSTDVRVMLIALVPLRRNDGIGARLSWPADAQLSSLGGGPAVAAAVADVVAVAVAAAVAAAVTAAPTMPVDKVASAAAAPSSSSRPRRCRYCRHRRCQSGAHNRHHAGFQAGAGMQLHVVSRLQPLPAGDDPSVWLKRTRRGRAGAGYRVANTRSRRPNAGGSLPARAGGSCRPPRPSSATVQEERREKARCRRLHSPRSAWKPDITLRYR